MSTECVPRGDGPAVFPVNRAESPGSVPSRTGLPGAALPGAVPPRAPRRRLPFSALLALAAACFVTVMTEALPAGLLPQMSADLGVSQSTMGHSVTVFAVGSLLAAIPLTALTAGWPRRRLILITLAGFVLSTAVTAASSDLALTLASRFVGGVAAGLLWALAAGYARRLVAPQNAGRAMAIAMAGVPIGFSLGLPAGTFLGGLMDWRISFWLLSGLAVVVAAWVRTAVPDFAGVARRERVSVARAVVIPGVRPVLLVTLLYVLAHNILYTYIAPYLAAAGLAARVDLGLLIFGVVSLVSIGLVGMRIDRRLRLLMILSVMLLAGTAVVLAIAGTSPVVALAAMAVWGARVRRDTAASAIRRGDCRPPGRRRRSGDRCHGVECRNSGGAVLGGALLRSSGTGSFPFAVLALLVPAVVLVLVCRRAFPSARNSSGD